MVLYTVGYSLWPVARRMPALLDCLQSAGVRLLADVRHSPCASQIAPTSHYGPHDWNLQTAGRGLVAILANAGIEYRWLVELGNPQKNDPDMAVLREHLATRDDRWPVNRGLDLLRRLMTGSGPICLLCACDDARRCHRTVIAHALVERCPELGIEIRHLPALAARGKNA